MPDGNLFEIFQGENDENVTRIEAPKSADSSRDGSSRSRKNGAPSGDGSASSPEAVSSEPTSSSERADQSSEDGPVSPWLERTRYLRNRQSLLRRQNFWLRLLAGVLAIATVAAMGVNLWLSSASQVEPVYVPVDKSSKEVQQPQRVDQIQTLSEPLVQNQLREVIRGLRTVYADFRATKRAYRDAWNYIQPGSEAEVFLKEVYNVTTEEDVTSPTALTGSVQRQVSDLEVVPIEGSDSYNLQWVEREAQLSSETLVENVYVGSVSIVRVEQNDIEALRENPTGLFIKGLTWQETESKIIRSSAGSSDEDASSGSSAKGSAPTGRSSSN